MNRSQIRRTSALKKRSKHQAYRISLLKKEYERVFSEPQRCCYCGGFGADTPHHHTEKRRNGDGLFHFIPIHDSPVPGKDCHYKLHHTAEGVRRGKDMGLLDCDWSERLKRMVHIPNPLFLDDEP